ncbi:MAG: hypothetical protein U0872_02110 [Planctomycetaceae bacterium]
MLIIALITEKVFGDGGRRFVGGPVSVFQHPDGVSGHEGLTGLSAALEIVVSIAGQKIGRGLKLLPQARFIDRKPAFASGDQGHGGKALVVTSKAILTQFE